MSKEIYISSTPHETRLAIVENDALTEVYYERENEYTLAGSIYNGKVTRVLPGMQSSFVDIGLERDAFLYITDFMEEAGDSADFDTSAHGGEPRAPREFRGDNQRGENQRGEGQREGQRDRGGRERSGERTGGRNGERTVEPAAEPTDSDLFNAAVSSLDPARPVENTRGDDRNGGQRGGRNRRDRPELGGNRADRSRGDLPRSEVPREETDYFRPDSPTLHVVPLTVAPIQPSELEPELAGEGAPFAESVGEGAPGADGSRRWRGRRGRRGGRGPGREDGTRVEVGQQMVVPRPAPGDISYVDYDRLDIDASAAPPVVPIDPSPTVDSAFVRPDREPRGGGDWNARNERDAGRDRGRDRGPERGPERGPDRGGRDARAPRGFAPKTPYAAASSFDPAPVYGQEVEPEVPVEPIILPGESLSKYRKGEQASAPSAPQAGGLAGATVLTPRPSTEFSLNAAWDGGLVLPGETIRRREPSRAEASHAVAPVSSGFIAPPPVPRGYTPEPAAVEAPAESGTIAMPEPQSAPEVIAAVPAAPLEPAQPEPEYEPSEASASYRVDPAPLREFRQASPAVMEPEIPEATLEPEPAMLEFEPENVQPESLVPELAIPESPVLDSLAEPAEAFGSLEASPGAHEITNISETGDMHSEPPFDAAAPAVAEAVSPLEVTGVELPAPAHHDLAVAYVEDAEEREETQPASHAAAREFETPAPYFAPGSGLLEEEVLEDDDDLPVLHGSASSIDEFEEEETLEGAADLGSMLREMSLDEMTRATPAVEEDEDDFDDFLEEDQDYTLEDEEDEEEGEDGQEEEESQGSGSDRDAENAAFAHDEDFAVHTAEVEGDTAEGFAEAAPGSRIDGHSEPRRDGNFRREGRRGDRNRRSGRPGRERSASPGHQPERSASDRAPERGPDRSSDRNPDRGSHGNGHGNDRGRRDGRGGRSAQSTNMPAISDLLKPGQEILCQIAKEPIAKKGARITSHIALPGRFLVFMPTVNHTGVSRKIESDGERRRLKEILLSEKGEAAGGFIVRTAASGASEEELRSDLRFLLNLWTDIKARSESSKSPALIYHDLNLVERVLRDQVTDTFSAIWVDSETEYERVLRFLQRFQPSLIRRVKLYTKETPLFEQFGITDEINKALRSKVWLKSGGSIVINQTEALVAIDINTGKYVGKTARLEDTIVKTNLDAIPEIVRQIRLRDLGGIIIIDFIDMDERKNRNKVMAALEEELKSDRAPSKVLQFNDFGLVAITRKRVKQSLERTLSTTCAICAGTGMVKSPVTVCNDIYIGMRKMQQHLDRGDVMLRVNPEVVKQLKAPGTKWLQEMEEMVGKTILVKSDPSLHPEQFDIH
jgi:ribonuclease G